MSKFFILLDVKSIFSGFWRIHAVEGSQNRKEYRK